MIKKIGGYCFNIGLNLKKEKNQRMISNDIKKSKNDEFVNSTNAFEKKISFKRRLSGAAEIMPASLVELLAIIDNTTGKKITSIRETAGEFYGKFKNNPISLAEIMKQKSNLSGDNFGIALLDYKMPKILEEALDKLIENKMFDDVKEILVDQNKDGINLSMSLISHKRGDLLEKYMNSLNKAGKTNAVIGIISTSDREENNLFIHFIKGNQVKSLMRIMEMLQKNGENDTLARLVTQENVNKENLLTYVVKNKHEETFLRFADILIAANKKGLVIEMLNNKKCLRMFDENQIKLLKQCIEFKSSSNIKVPLKTMYETLKEEDKAREKLNQARALYKMSQAAFYKETIDVDPIKTA